MMEMIKKYVCFLMMWCMLLTAWCAAPLTVSAEVATVGNTDWVKEFNFEDNTTFDTDWLSWASVAEKTSLVGGDDENGHHMEVSAYTGDDSKQQGYQHGVGYSFRGNGKDVPAGSDFTVSCRVNFNNANVAAITMAENHLNYGLTLQYRENDGQKIFYVADNNGIGDQSRQHYTLPESSTGWYNIAVEYDNATGFGYLYLSADDAELMDTGCTIYRRNYNNKPQEPNVLYFGFGTPTKNGATGTFYVDDIKIHNKKLELAPAKEVKEFNFNNYETTENLQEDWPTWYSGFNYSGDIKTDANGTYMQVAAASHEAQPGMQHGVMYQFRGAGKVVAPGSNFTIKYRVKFNDAEAVTLTASNGHLNRGMRLTYDNGMLEVKDAADKTAQMFKVSSDRWHDICIVYTYDTDQTKEIGTGHLYLDGIDTGCSIPLYYKTGTSEGEPNNLYFGYRTNENSAAKGAFYVDDVEIYNRDLLIETIELAKPSISVDGEDVTAWTVLDGNAYQSGALLLAQYDSQDQLVAVEVDSNQALTKAGDTTSNYNELVKTDTLHAEATKVKAFLWNGLTDMNPYCTAVELTKQGDSWK